MKQVETSLGPYAPIMRSAPFVRGFNDARKNKTFFPDLYADEKNANAQWAYERGRQFAIIYNGALKNGARLTYGARAAMNNAIHDRLII
jgi:hypothetical protein